MKRVASLYLPNWSIDRVRRNERRKSPLPAEADGRAAYAALGAEAAAERAKQCSVPRKGHWRPGARWARDRGEVEAAIEALPPHQRPPLRELGRLSEKADSPFAGSHRELSRRTEAADHPFRTLPPDEGGSARSVPRRVRSGNATAIPACTATPAKGAPSGSDEPPLVTTHKVRARVEIAAVNRAARLLGLQPGMALTMARAQVPGLEVRPADPEGDAAEMQALAELLARRWSPTVTVPEADGLFIDLTGVAHLHGGELHFARRLVRLLASQGFEARVAVADTPGAAWALARGGGTAIQVIAPGDHIAALALLPVAALRLETASLELLARLGVDRVGQLLELPRAPLVRRFGRAIVDRLDQATGRAPEPFAPITLPARVAVEQRFAEPIASAEAIEHWLRKLMPRLTRALAEAGQGARSVELVAERIDGIPQRLRIGFARPTRDPAHMLRLALRRIEEIAPGYGIDALRLHVHRADPLGPETLLSQALDTPFAHEGEADLAVLIDTLANRIGIDRLWRMTPVESDVPERSLASLPPLDPPRSSRDTLKREDVRRLDTRAPDHPWHPRWPRPVRLLRRPEPVDHVMAELPDQPPLRFTWRGVTHRVVRADGPERIAGEWWRRPAERDAVRDYFRVEDEAGQRFWLYRRGDGIRPETGDLRWFIHGRGA